MSNASAVTSRRVLMTPAIADQMLFFSKGNRGLRKARVETYITAMLAGEWLENGDTIRMYDDGTLQDGHHRLTACVQSGVSFYTILVRGITKDAAKTVDKGAPRSNADELALHAELTTEDAGIASGIANLVMIHDLGLDSWAATGGSNSKHLTATKVTRWVGENKDEVLSAVQWSKSAIRKGNTMLPKSSAAGLLILGARVDEVSSREFLEQVFLGYGVTPGSTEDHVRTALLAAAMGARKIDRRTRVLSVAKGMKSVMAGRNIKHAGNAMFRSSDPVPTFPKKNEDAA